nr:MULTISPECIES: hypothetical protein [unclassified Bartonella]
MLFLHLYCKKENFLPFTTWLLLSGFGVLLASNLEKLAYLIKQPQANNIVSTNTLDPQNEYHHLNVSENKKFVTLHTDSVLPINIVQNILTLNPFLITSVMICRRFEHLQTQYFTNKRAPPLT